MDEVPEQFRYLHAEEMAEDDNNSEVEDEEQDNDTVNSEPSATTSKVQESKAFDWCLKILCFEHAG